MDREKEAWAGSARQGAAVAAALAAAGIRDFVVSPGSRSTPLVLALSARADVQPRVILDERSAGFFALGLADRTHRPVGLVCTSGTAGANYLPAVIEAWHRRVPLLLLTADRPPELRDCGAGQTIDQVGLFGKFVRWEADACAPEGEAGLRYLRGLASEAVRGASGPVPGPAHLNLPFREPFLPPAPMEESPDLSGQPGRPRSAGAPSFDWELLRCSGPGWIVAGPANPRDPAGWADGLFRLSDFLGWPVLCDATNPGRHAPGATERVVTQYEGLLAAGLPEKRPALAPSAVLQVGPLPTAKPLRQWLDRFGGPRWQWSGDPACLDPSRSGAVWIPGDPAGLEELPGEFADGLFRSAWLEAERSAVARVEEWLSKIPGRFEGKVHRVLAGCVPAEGQIFWSNSLPVRDAERFWFADRSRGPRAFSNRGASGIDGIISTAAGLADGGPPTTAVVGDLAFLHDCGGLRAAAALEGSLTLIVLDNGGGRIFGQLPIARREEVFGRFFLTPQAVDLPALCAAHGIPAEVVDDVAETIPAELRKARQGVRVLIVRTDPERDERLRTEWRALFPSLLAEIKG